MHMLMHEASFPSLYLGRTYVRGLHRRKQRCNGPARQVILYEFASLCRVNPKETRMQT